MVRILAFTLFLAVVTLQSATVVGRTWSDVTGKFKVEADLIAQNDEHAVLKTAKGKLLALDIKQLSEDDQKFLATSEASADRLAGTDKTHVWLLKIKDMKVVGQLVTYCAEDYFIERGSGAAVVNGKPERDLPELFRKILPAIVNHFEKADIVDHNSLVNWLNKQGKTQHKYHVEGVQLRLASGVDLRIPIFLFGDQEQYFLMPGLERWRALQAEKLEANNKAQLERREQVMMEASARAFQANQAIQARAQVMQLELLAVATGAVELWEVGLLPNTPYGHPFTVIVPARNSLTAEQQALQRYPGTRVAATRKFAGY